MRLMETLRVLVTGCSGFLGSYVSEAMVRAGHDVVGVDLNPPSDRTLHFESVDFTSRDQLGPILHNVDSVCHLGGIGDVYLAERDPGLAFRINAHGSLVVHDACVAAGVATLVHASTWEVYGRPIFQPMDETHPCNPESAYSISKLAGELCVRMPISGSALRVVVLRLGTAYGQRMRDTAVISKFISLGRQGSSMPVQGTGKQFRQFTHARDIANGFLLATNHPNSIGIYNLLAQQRTSIIDLAKMISSHFGNSIELKPARGGDPPSVQVSSKRAEQELQWSPKVSLEAGIAELINGGNRTQPTY